MFRGLLGDRGPKPSPVIAWTVDVVSHPVEGLDKGGDRLGDASLVVIF